MNQPFENSPTAVDSAEDEKSAQQAFITANAEYFAQAMSPLHSIFRTSGMMNIVSEESDFTIVVGINPAGEDGFMDVDCAILEPNQESLKACLDTLFA